MGDTVTELFEERIEKSGRNAALYFKEDGQWKSISWSEYGSRVMHFSRGLIALGVKTGDKVALIGSNSPDWFVADMAIMTMGAVSVPIYATSSGEQISYQLNHSESRVFVVQGLEYLQRIEALLDQVPMLLRVVVLKVGVSSGAKRVMDLESFRRLAESVGADKVQELRRAVVPDGLATIIYTSGTTGPPKAVMLTHRNCVAAARNVYLSTGTRSGDKDRVTCSYLPLSHVAERVVNLHSSLLDGRAVYFMGGYQQFLDDLREIRPTVWAGVPRVWEKLYEGVMAQRDKMPQYRRRIIEWALRAGRDYNWGKYNGSRLSFRLRVEYALARLLVIKRLLAALGLDRVETTVTGGAPTTREILDFFMALGIWLQDVYGQTEGHGTTSFATKDAIRFGSAGKPFPLVEVRFAEDGEILVKGDNVSPGYFKDPALTEETFRDGWLHSGDLGYLDEDGFLWVTGRKKDIIITSGGKNITPSKIETALMGCPLIENAVVVGEGKKYLTALLTLSPEGGSKFCEQLGIRIQGTEELFACAALKEGVEQHLKAVNAELSRVEQIKKYRILPVHFSIEGGELTHILKVKRDAVQKKYAEEIEEMYS
jgi:long-chain acyl-CoA synthetase